MALLLSSDDSLADKLDEAIDISENDPKIILQTLQSSLKEDFPDAVSSQYTLKYVPESLEDSMNPAFYMIPPVDVTDSNVIYLNNSQITDNLSLFTTLAHEGYPGHLYQQSAFSATDPDPLQPGYETSLVMWQAGPLMPKICLTHGPVWMTIWPAACAQSGYHAGTLRPDRSWHSL